MSNIFKVMCDYCAEGFWHNNACAEPKEYLSLELAQKLIAWNKQYETEPPKNLTHWESHIEFMHTGLALAVAVKNELKKQCQESFSVWFYDPERVIHGYHRAGSLPHERAYIVI